VKKDFSFLFSFSSDAEIGAKQFYGEEQQNLLVSWFEMRGVEDEGVRAGLWNGG